MESSASETRTLEMLEELQDKLNHLTGRLDTVEGTVSKVGAAVKGSRFAPKEFKNAFETNKKGYNRTIGGLDLATAPKEFKNAFAENKKDDNRTIDALDLATAPKDAAKEELINTLAIIETTIPELQKISDEITANKAASPEKKGIMDKYKEKVSELGSNIKDKAREIKISLNKKHEVNMIHLKHDVGNIKSALSEYVKDLSPKEGLKEFRHNVVIFFEKIGELLNKLLSKVTGKAIEEKPPSKTQIDLRKMIAEETIKDSGKLQEKATKLNTTLSSLENQKTTMDEHKFDAKQEDLHKDSSALKKDVDKQLKHLTGEAEKITKTIAALQKADVDVTQVDKAGKEVKASLSSGDITTALISLKTLTKEITDATHKVNEAKQSVESVMDKTKPAQIDKTKATKETASTENTKDGGKPHTEFTEPISTDQQDKSKGKERT